MGSVFQRVLTGIRRCVCSELCARGANDDVPAVTFRHDPERLTM